MVNVRKRGKVYEYRIEIAFIDNKRKWITKSGFNTKSEAYEAGTFALNEYLSAGTPFKPCNMSYSDYLDYWIKNYCEINLKYNTIQAYKVLIRKYIKPRLGHYKLSTIASVCLNNFITNLVNEYSLSKLNYVVHTDTVKTYIVPTLTEEQKKFVYANEVDVLNVALFGTTAKEWRENNPELVKSGNIRDYTDLLHLVILNNLENTNAELIESKVSQSEWLIRLNNSARWQMKVLKDNKNIKDLELLQN